jgi:hypothetical protein
MFVVARLDAQENTRQQLHEEPHGACRIETKPAKINAIRLTYIA